MPGVLLTGWAPVRVPARPIHVIIRDFLEQDASSSLRQGVELGLEDVTWSARILRLPLEVIRLCGSEPYAEEDETAVQVIVASEDDCHGTLTTACGTRIYTCPLREWRPDAWSVATPLVAVSAGSPRLDWHPALAAPGAAQLNARFARHAGVPMDAAAWHGWMAIKVGFDVALRGTAGELDLLALQFDGHKGTPLHFSEDGHLVQPTVRLVDGRAHWAEPIDFDLLSTAS